MTSDTSGCIEARAFRNALGKYATGVAIVTCDCAHGPLGMTANSFASVSLEPPLVLWSPAKASKRFAAFESAAHFAIHVLDENQRHFCEAFASEGSNFSSVDWQVSDKGVPLIANTLARFECERYDVHDGGDHAIIVGKVTKAAFREGNPLVFAGGRFGRFSGMA